MATYTYTTSPDEDAALDLELMMINGQLVSQKKSPVDLQGMFTLFVADKLSPMKIQVLQNRVAPILNAFINADEQTRAQILAAAPVKAT